MLRPLDPSSGPPPREDRPARPADLAAAAAGLCSVLLLVFTSTKLRRLIGRSTYRYGESESASELAEAHGGMPELRASLSAALSNNAAGEVRFSAREWYYTHDGGPGLCGAQHFSHGLALFGAELACYMASAALRASASLPITHGVLSAAVLLLSPLVVVDRLRASGALHLS